MRKLRLLKPAETSHKMEDFVLNHKRHDPGDCSWTSGGPFYWYTYPRSFVMRPQRGTVVSSTLNQINPPELTFQDWRLLNGNWHTTTGLAHGHKSIEPEFYFPLLNKAPSAMKMDYIFPDIENKMKGTSRGMYYDPMPFGNTITKTDYKARWPIADFDYDNGPLVQVSAPRYVRVTKRSYTKPVINPDEDSIIKKFNPYLSVTKLDYINRHLQVGKYDICGCRC